MSQELVEHALLDVGADLVADAGKQHRLALVLAMTVGRDEPQRAIEAGLSGDRELSVRTMFEVSVSAAYAAAAGNFDVFREQALSVRVPIPVVLMQSQAVLRHDALERLAGITAPTMVIHGTADEMLLPTNAELIAKSIPGAHLELFEGVGHLFWWEEPERTASLLRVHAGPAA